MLLKLFPIGMAGCLLALVQSAGAHAHLEKALPAADSKMADVQEIRLAFSEAVEPKLSSIRLETAEERTVTEPGAEVDAADPKMLVVHLYEKLPPGSYKVRWSVVAADGHKTSGSYAFLSSR
jgi:methionine-rich copper-binding protein CopC